MENYDSAGIPAIYATGYGRINILAEDRPTEFRVRHRPF